MEHKRRLSAVLRGRSKTDAHLAAILRALQRRPNKPEAKLFTLLQRTFPNDWAYTGDGSVILAGKCPDFMNINGQKAIIEMYGDWFHRGEDETARAACFAPLGYQTLVVWEHELNDPEAVIKKIQMVFYAGTA